MSRYVYLSSPQSELLQVRGVTGELVLPPSWTMSCLSFGSQPQAELVIQRWDYDTDRESDEERSKNVIVRVSWLEKKKDLFIIEPETRNMRTEPEGREIRDNSENNRRKKEEKGGDQMIV